MAAMEESLYKFALITFLILADIILFICWGMPSGFIKIMSKLERVPQFRNEDQEPPLLIKREVLDASANVEMWTFQSYGIGFSTWTERRTQEQLENALDIAVLGVDYGKNSSCIELKVIVHPGPWPTVIPWKDNYLPEDDACLCLGLNRSYPITVNLSVHPHYLIGGETGSGKTVLIKSLIYQALKKGFKVTLIDMKHFVDYAKLVPLVEDAIDDESALDETLNSLVAEMHRRLGTLRDSGCKNIDEYNTNFPEEKMPRMLVVIDEYMEAIVKFGDKNQKARGEQNEAKIATLCKLSRAAGISVIIGLQRAGMDLSGQIRSNTRVIIGSCNDNLSIVMTGSTDLGRLIPRDSVGMFVTEDRQLFKAFFSDFEY